MPFAKNAAGVAALIKHLRQRGGIECHAFALEDGVCYAVFHRVSTGHQGGARWGAGGAHHEPREAGARVVQFVQMRRANPRMSMPPDRPVALVIRDDENDVGFLSFRIGGPTEDTEKQ